MNNTTLLIIGHCPNCDRPIYVLTSNSHCACGYAYSNYNNRPTTII